MAGARLTLFERGVGLEGSLLEDSLALNVDGDALRFLSDWKNDMATQTRRTRMCKIQGGEWRHSWES